MQDVSGFKVISKGPYFIVVSDDGRYWTGKRWVDDRDAARWMDRATAARTQARLSGSKVEPAVRPKP